MKLLKSSEVGQLDVTSLWVAADESVAIPSHKGQVAILFSHGHDVSFATSQETICKHAQMVRFDGHARLKGTQRSPPWYLRLIFRSEGAKYTDSMDDVANVDLDSDTA